MNKTTTEDLMVLKNFIDRADESETDLKLDILGWMFDNLLEIKIQQLRKKQFHLDVLAFLERIEDR